MSLNPAQRDLASSASTKLAVEWTACAFSNQLSRNRPTDSSSRIDSLDPLVRSRLLLSGLYVPQPISHDVRAELQRLAGQAQKQEDEWLRIVGLTVGDFSGTLDTQALLQESVVVRDSITSIESLLQQMSPQPAHRPLEDAYLNSNVAEGLRGFPARPHKHQHFQLRRGSPAEFGAFGFMPESNSSQFTSTLPEHSPVDCSAAATAAKDPALPLGKAVVKADIASAFRTSRPEFRPSAFPQADKKLESRDSKIKQLDVEAVAELNQRSRNLKQEVHAEAGLPVSLPPPPASKPAPDEGLPDAKSTDLQAQSATSDPMDVDAQDREEDGQLSEDDNTPQTAQKRARTNEWE